MKMINLTIDGIPVSVPEGSTVLEAAKEANINIPTLCYLKDVQQIGACRLCLVEIKGARALAAACVMPVGEGMEVKTNTPKSVREERSISSCCFPTTTANVPHACVRASASLRRCVTNTASTAIPSTAKRATRALTTPPLHCQGQFQVRSLPPLRCSLQQNSAGGRYRRHQQRYQDLHCLRL